MFTADRVMADDAVLGGLGFGNDLQQDRPEAGRYLSRARSRSMLARSCC